MGNGGETTATGNQLRSGVSHRAGSAARLRGPRRVARIVHILFNHQRYHGKVVTLAGEGGEFQSRPIKLVANRAKQVRKYIATFENQDIPAGSYRLTVPVPNALGDDYQWDLELDYTFENVENDSGRVAGGRGRRAKFVMQVGDAYTLEEALLRQFSTKYSHLIAQLLDESDDAEIAAHSPLRTSFGTYINFAKDTNSTIKSGLGWVGQDNSYFKLLEELYSRSSYGPISDDLDNIRLFEDPNPPPTLMLRGQLVADTPNNRLKHTIDSANGWGPYKFASVALDWLSFGNDVMTLFQAYSGMPAAQQDYWDYVRRYTTTNRHAMIKAETFRAQTDMLAANAAVEGLKFTYSTAWIGIGLVFSGPAFEVVDAAIDVAKDALSALDHFLFDEALGNYWRRLHEWWGELAAVAHNDSSILYWLIGGDRNNARVARIVNMRVRAKVLYHLMQLIDRCGSYERNAPAFRRKVRENKIGQFINQFILRRRFWVNIEVINHDWLSLYWDETDRATRNRMISFRRPRGARGHRWFPVHFQEQFPIHLMEHDSAFSLARDLSQDYSGITERDIERTFFQWGRNRGSRQEPRWEWTTLREGDQIGSELPVRVVVLLRSGTSVRIGYPVEVTLYRVDGVNAEGPKYSGAVRPVTDADGLSGMTGRRAAILEFSYSYQFRVYRGLKPMKSWWHSTIPQTMYMAAYYRVGDNDLQDWVADGLEIPMTFYSHSPGHRAPSAMNIRNMHKFGDLAFLQRRSTSEAQNFPVEERWLESIKIQKQSGSSWQTMRAGDSLNVHQGIRVAVLFRNDHQLRPGTPVSVKVVRTDGANVTGPVYRTNVITRQSEFGNKPGAVIPLYYWRFVNKLEGNAESWEQDRVSGIKPVATFNYGTIELDGFTFDLLVSIGDGISDKRAEPDDIPLRFTSSQMRTYTSRHMRFVNDSGRWHIKAVMWREGFPGTLFHGSDAFYDSLRPRLESGELGEDVANEIERPLPV